MHSNIQILLPGQEGIFFFNIVNSLGFEMGRHQGKQKEYGSRVGFLCRKHRDQNRAPYGTWAKRCSYLAHIGQAGRMHLMGRENGRGEESA